MSKYIDSEKLIDEIKRRIENWTTRGEHSPAGQGRDTCESRVTELSDLLSFITSLQQEQPEVDFEKAYKSYMQSRKDDLSENAVTVNMKDLARYFWNKGFNARKEK